MLFYEQGNVCELYGVIKCDYLGNIIKLDLYDNRLTALPPELCANLKDIQDLHGHKLRP